MLVFGYAALGSGALEHWHNAQHAAEDAKLAAADQPGVPPLPELEFVVLTKSHPDAATAEMGALLAALAMQERFAAATETEPDLPLQVGIGLDVGEAVPVEDGYRGVALNRAARLCSLAAAGEILVTTGLVYVAAKVEGIHFTEHSQAQLKGFEPPVAVMRVSASPPIAPPE